MKRIALRFKEAFRSAFGEDKAVVDSTHQCSYDSAPRVQVQPTGEEHASTGDERTFERAFAERSSMPGIQYC